MGKVKKPWWAKKNPERWEQLEFNFLFLKEVEKQLGRLHCEYCGQKNLVIYEFHEKVNNKDVATADHFYPKSKYPELAKVKSNMIVSCHDCNSNKKDDVISEEEIKYRRK
jgi:5-methylcytosine-specific restriction endonuclease McrA